MPSSETARTVSLFTTKDGIVSYARIEPPLTDFEHYKRVCAVAYGSGDAAPHEPSEHDFERSLFEESTELRFVGRSEDELIAAGRHVAEALRACSMPASLDDTVRLATA